MKRHFLKSPTRQRGMATMLVVLLAGTAITATTLGVMYQVRSTQDQQMAVHASTQSESLAWAGVELTRLYLESKSSLDSVPVDELSVSGISGLTIEIIDNGVDDGKVIAEITGSTDLASTTLKVVYKVTTSGGSTSAGGALTASLVWNGDVTYSGGGLTITNGTNLANVAINGDLTIQSGATATIAGCATGDISLSGGGVTSTSLLAEGDISISSMKQPSGLTVWGKNIYITQSGGNYNSIQAGAFTAEVIANSAAIGTTITGGSGFINSTTIIPLTSGIIALTLDDGTIYTLDMSKATQSNGVITTTATGAATRIKGSTALPETISLRFTGIHGGAINFLTGTVGTLWGNTASLTGWDGTYTSFKVNSNANVINPKISTLQGGGDLWATSAGCSGSGSGMSCWSMPSVTSGNIAGNFFYGSSKTQIPANQTISGINLQRAQSGITPGLPGIPYCDVNPNPVDVDALRSSANYVFYFEGNTPKLTVQNVKTASGTSIDGTYDILTTDLRTIAGQDFMQCNWYNDHCLRNATPETGWNLSGIYRFPKGILWFDGDVTINGVDNANITALYNSILTKGDVDLTSKGHVPLYAPNFATAATICGGNLYPTNLCSSTSSFTTWTGTDGTTHTGLPIGNVAIAAEGDLKSSGWTIYGNVLLGGAANTAGATTTIYGGLSVGGNTVSNTTVSAGGLVVNTANMSADQTYVPSENDDSSNGAGSTTTASVLWAKPL